MGGAYGFGFDDNLNQSSVIIDNKAPTHLIVTIPAFRRRRQEPQESDLGRGQVALEMSLNRLKGIFLRTERSKSDVSVRPNEDHSAVQQSRALRRQVES